MTDELKSAIDRLQRINAGESLTDVYCFDGVKLSGVAAEGLAEACLQCDYKLVAEAHLARLAEDAAGDEPVTEEWLKANGFIAVDDCRWRYRNCSYIKVWRWLRWWYLYIGEASYMIKNTQTLRRITSALEER